MDLDSPGFWGSWGDFDFNFEFALL